MSEEREWPMDTEDAVEIMAPALCSWRNGKPNSVPLEKMPAKEQAAYRDQARAAYFALHQQATITRKE